MRTRGQRWERRSEIPRSQGPEAPRPPTIGRGGSYPECKGQPLPYRLQGGDWGRRCYWCFLTSQKESGSSQTQPFREAVGLGVDQSILRYNKSQKPHSFRSSRSLRPRSGRGRPADGADTGRPKTPRAQNHTLPCSLAGAHWTGWGLARTQEDGQQPLEYSQAALQASTCNDPSLPPLLR